MLQLTLYTIVPTVVGALLNAVNTFGISPYSVWYLRFYSIVDIIIYAIIFILPALFIKKFLPISENAVTTQFALPKNFIKIGVCIICLVIFVSNFTQIIQNIISLFGIGFRNADISIPTDWFDVCTLTISLAITPAIVEELLFRKVILNGLLPYGKTFSIITSAILFSLMHSNPSQFVFAFVAGLFFAHIALETKSIFPTMILHFANNFISVIYLTLYGLVPQEEVSSYIVLIADRIIGAAGAIILLIYYKKITPFIKDYLEKTKEENALSPTDFSLVRTSVRIIPLLYLAYVIYLTSRWIYII